MMEKRSKKLFDYEKKIAAATMQYNFLSEDLDESLSYEEKIILLELIGVISLEIYRLKQVLPFVRMECCDHILGLEYGVDILSGKALLKCFCPKCGLQNFYSADGYNFVVTDNIFKRQLDEGYLMGRILTVEEVAPQELRRVYKNASGMTGTNDSEVLRPIMLALLNRKKQKQKSIIYQI